jgi:hypothetical protein
MNRLKKRLESILSGKAQLQLKASKSSILEKGARQAKAKARKGGKGKGTFVIEPSPEPDYIESEELGGKEEEEEDPERVGLVYRPPITDPFENQHNYISWK